MPTGSRDTCCSTSDAGTRPDHTTKRRFRLNPNNAEAHATFANFNVLTGKPADAVKLAEKALHLDPQPPSWCYWAQGFALVANEQFDDAIRTLRRQEVYRTVARRVLAAALALSGQRDKAAREARYFLSSFPRLAHFDLDGNPAVSAQPRRSVLGRCIQACRSPRLTPSVGGLGTRCKASHSKDLTRGLTW